MRTAKGIIADMDRNVAAFERETKRGIGAAEGAYASFMAAQRAAWAEAAASGVAAEVLAILIEERRVGGYSVDYRMTGRH